VLTHPFGIASRTRFFHSTLRDIVVDEDHKVIDSFEPLKCVLSLPVAACLTTWHPASYLLLRTCEVVTAAGA
jgi:hypothetical protein